MIIIMTAGDAEDAWQQDRPHDGHHHLVFFDFNCSSELRCKTCVDMLRKRCVDMLIMMTPGDAQDAS